MQNSKPRDSLVEKAFEEEEVKNNLLDNGYPDCMTSAIQQIELAIHAISARAYSLIN